MCAPDVELLLRVPVAASDSSFFLWLSLAACRGVGQRIFVWFEDVEWVWTVRGVRGDLSLSPPPYHVPSVLITNITNLAQASIARDCLTRHKRAVIKACARCRRCCPCRFSAVSWAVWYFHNCCYYCLLILVLLADSGLLSIFLKLGGDWSLPAHENL